MLATSQWILAGCVTSDLRTSSPRYRQVLAWLTTHPAERFGGLDMPSASGQCAPQEWRGGHQTTNLVLDPRRPSLTEFLTEDDSAPGGPQDTRRTGSTRFWDVSSTGGPQATRRTISGRLRIWRLGVRVPRGALLTSGFAARAVSELHTSHRVNLRSNPRGLAADPDASARQGQAPPIGLRSAGVPGLAAGLGQRQLERVLDE